MFILNKKSSTPYSIQISQAYEKLILSGYFSHGEKLPTLMDIKNMFNVSIKVAAQAYDVLNEKGYIYSRRGKGFFVSHHQKLLIDLEDIDHIENKLIYEKNMVRNIILLEVVEVEHYIAEQLSLNENSLCYHIKQFYGRGTENVLLQDAYLPYKLFPNLETTISDYPTLRSIVIRGYGYKVEKLKNKYFPSQSSFEQIVTLKLQPQDPIWRIESIGTIHDKPIILINHYLSGEYTTMAVMLSV